MRWALLTPTRERLAYRDRIVSALWPTVGTPCRRDDRLREHFRYWTMPLRRGLLHIPAMPKSEER